MTVHPPRAGPHDSDDVNLRTAQPRPVKAEALVGCLLMRLERVHAFGGLDRLDEHSY